MLRWVQLYKNSAELDAYLAGCRFNKEATCLVKLFTSVLSPQQAVAAAKEIKTLLPNATIVGSSSAKAVLFNGEQREHETIVIIETYQRLQIQVEKFPYKGICERQLAKQVHSAFCEGKDHEPALVHILFANPQVDVDSSGFDVNRFVCEANNFTPFLRLCGGIAGDLYEQGIPGYVFDETGVLDFGAIAFVATDKAVHDFVGVSNSMETLSSVFEITKTEDVFIDEVEGHPALDWVYDFLELEEDKRVGYQTVEDTIKYDYLLHFPLVIENTGGSGRFARFDEKQHKLGLYHARLDNHTKFRMGYVNPMKTVQETRQLCEDLLDTPTEYLFAYVCLFRKLCLNNCAKWELMPFQKYDLCGIFMMGEIACQNGCNCFHNGACVLTGIAENEKYILPDVHCLDNTDPLKDDLVFLKKAKDKGKAYLQSKGTHLVLSADNEQMLTKYNNIDEYTGLYNFYQFEEDKISNKYNKLLLVESLTADSSIAIYGHQKYYEAMRDVIATVQGFLKENKLSDHLNSYTLNYKTNILAASVSVSEEYFLECTRLLYEKFEYVLSSKENISGVLRFVSVLNQDNLIEAGMNMLLANTSQDNNYLVCDYSVGGNQTVAEESNIIDVLSRAINKRTVIPFYQGIRNNKTGKIDKYEALMRVVDSTGKVYTPFSFMEIAKKYKYYGRISQMMVRRVLEDFQNRPESVSLNITLHDVQSKSFRTWLFETLQNYPNPQRIVFEIVETENYHSVELLVDFVCEIRKLGCAIAIDDFGSGYSTLAAVINLRPDYIKIDGSIIRGLLTNEESLIILNTIRYLAQQLGVETVAEFVETKELQQVVELYTISYSQGYYFAKPEPIELLPPV